MEENKLYGHFEPSLSQFDFLTLQKVILFAIKISIPQGLYQHLLFVS